MKHAPSRVQARPLTKADLRRLTQQVDYETYKVGHSTYFMHVQLNTEDDHRATYKFENRFIRALQAARDMLMRLGVKDVESYLFRIAHFGEILHSHIQFDDIGVTEQGDCDMLNDAILFGAARGTIRFSGGHAQYDIDSVIKHAREFIDSETTLGQIVSEDFAALLRRPLSSSAHTPLTAHDQPRPQP